jgi:hypothetical protein
MNGLTNRYTNAQHYTEYRSWFHSLVLRQPSLRNERQGNPRTLDGREMHKRLIGPITYFEPEGPACEAGPRTFQEPEGPAACVHP